LKNILLGVISCVTGTILIEEGGEKCNLQDSRRICVIWQKKIFIFVFFVSS